MLMLLKTQVVWMFSRCCIIFSSDGNLMLQWGQATRRFCLWETFLFKTGGRSSCTGVPCSWTGVMAPWDMGIKIVHFLQCISVICCKNLMAQACLFWPRVLLVQNSPPGLATTAGKYSLQQSPYIQQQISKVVLTYLHHHFCPISFSVLPHHCYLDLQWTLENIH